MYWANPNGEQSTIVTISCYVRWSPRLHVERMKKNGKNESGNKSRNHVKPKNVLGAPKLNGVNVKDKRQRNESVKRESGESARNTNDASGKDVGVELKTNTGANEKDEVMSELNMEVRLQNIPVGHLSIYKSPGISTMDCWLGH